MSIVLRPRRLLVSGGSHLSPNAARLWEELGRLLAYEDGLVAITGGLAGRRDYPDARPADRAFVDGYVAGLHARRLPIRERLETFLPEQKDDPKRLIGFEEGLTVVLPHQRRQARRFSMVYSADVVITIEGEQGTRSVLDMALAVGKPVLPLPFRGGDAAGRASVEAWTELREEIRRWFKLDDSDIGRLEGINLPNLTQGTVKAVAHSVYDCLIKGFTRICFVIMPFHQGHEAVYDQAICPALAAHGLQPLRTDREVPFGNVLKAIRDGLEHCYFAIADTTGDRPNVMYELGMAHAENKPVILLRRAAPDGTLPPAPFDVYSESILKYTDDMDDLRKRLEAAVAVVRGETRGVSQIR